MTELRRTVLKQQSSAYLMVAFVAVCLTAAVHAPLALLVYLIPIAIAVYLARTATIVDEAGLHARAVFGSQLVGWDELRGLRLVDSGSVYAVSTDGTQLRLPCVRKSKLEPLIIAAAGRIPDPNGPAPTT